jgi:PKD repeat protein
MLGTTPDSLAQVADGAGADQTEPTERWCHTQIIFDEKRASDPSALSPEACSSYGTCDDPSERDGSQPNPNTPLTYIRLFFHVMTADDGSDPATNATNVGFQVDALNDHYLSYQIQFEYEMRFVASTQFRYLTTSYEFDQMKLAYVLDPANQLNIYVASVNVGGEVFSFGTFPWDGDALSTGGGIVMNRTQFYPYQPATLTHEIGHCIGLYHTFRGVEEVTTCGSCYEAVGTFDRDYTGDFCSDTDPTPLNYYCGPPGGTDPCSGLGWGITDPQNYMSYASSSCQTEFSSQQAGRFHCWIADRLYGWTIPFELEATPNFGPVPLTVDFQGSTEREPSEWSWDFGEGGTSDWQNPTHEFVEPGYHTVAASIQTPDGPYTKAIPGLVSAYADTLRFEDTEIIDGQARVDVYVRNYLPLYEIDIPIVYAGPVAIEYDSTSVVGLRSAGMTASRVSWVPSQDKMALHLAIDPMFAIEPGIGPVATIYFRDETGGATGETPITIEPYSIYELEFTSHAGAYSPVGEAGIVFQGCCRGVVGDVNGIGGDEPTIGDISILIDHLFLSGIELGCYPEADVNQSGWGNPDADDITIGDVSVLIDHLFITGLALRPCM